MVTVKASQKIFTDSEVASLTGICVDHLRNFAKSRHLGFIARAAERAGIQADQWLFTLSDLMVLVTLFPRCTHRICFTSAGEAAGISWTEDICALRLSRRPFSFIVPT